jgi:hypothetical protein
MRRERALGGRRDLDQSKAQRTARPMVPGRSRLPKHVRIPPLSAAFPRRSERTKKQLVARGGSPHAPNVNPFDSEACTAAQEARFFATRKLSSRRRRLRRPSAPTVASEPRCQKGMDRCVGTMARCRCAPTQSVADKHATSELRSRRPAQCHVRRAGAPGLLSVPRRFSPLCPATIGVQGLTMPESNISNGNGAHSSATAGKR